MNEPNQPAPTINHKQRDLLLQLAATLSALVRETETDRGFAEYVNTYGWGVLSGSWDEAAFEVMALAHGERDPGQ